jgi:hypothetical protein
MHLIIFGLLLLAFTASAAKVGEAAPKADVPAAPLGCDAAFKIGVPCSCDVRTLRPLQGAVGMEEVRDKAQKIAAKTGKEWQKLASDPIKVIRGPGGALFVTDHHHSADAWRLAGRPIAVCEIGERVVSANDTEFWSGLINDRLVHLADADGKPISPEQLPASLEAMPDDPYRSLAWRLRKEGGFCRSTMPQKEFAEFIWADWLRKQPELPADAVRASAKKTLPAALALARSAAAKDVLGYVGDKPSGFKCADD